MYWALLGGGDGYEGGELGECGMVKIMVSVLFRSMNNRSLDKFVTTAAVVARI